MPAPPFALPSTRALLLALSAGLVSAALVAAGALEAWERDVYDQLSRVATRGDERSELVSLVLLDEASLAWGRSYFERTRAGAAGGASADATAGGLRGHEFLFPWDRSVYDLLVQTLALGGARVLAFDVELAGPHPSGDASGDESLGLSSVMQNEFGEPFVVHALNLESSTEAAAEVVHLDALQQACLAGAARPVAGWERSGLPFARSDVGPYSNPVVPYRTILRAFTGHESLLRLGAVTAQPDPDGVIRRARPFVVWDGLCLPSLGLAAALAWWEAQDGAAPTGLAVQHGELVVTRAADAGTLRLPLSQSGDVLIAWRDDGREDPADPEVGRYPTWPAHRVLRSFMRAADIPGWEDPPVEDERYFLDPSVFAGRIVFLGSNAAGLRDLKATPVSADYPGVKVHAALAEALLLGEAVDRPGASLRAALAGVLAALSALLTVGRRSQRGTIGTVAALALTATLVSAWLFVAQGLWLDVVAPLFGVALAYTAGTTLNFLTEGRRSREITGLFGHFAPPAVVDRLIARPESISLRGEVREITVFFSDIQGFTSLSNTAAMRADPGRLTDHLNAYLSEMTRAITDCGGTVDKYIGDAVMALFGAPMDLENHALAACRAALLCQERLARFNAQAEQDGLPPLVTRIGLQSGEATVGCVGSRARLSYTAIGSTVNLASRLEGVNKVYGTRLMVGAETVRLAGAAVSARLIDRVRVPGIVDEAPPLELWQLLGLVGAGPGAAEGAVATVAAGGAGSADEAALQDGGPDAEQVAGYERGRALYEQGRFAEAAQALAPWAERGDPPARVLYDRSVRLAGAPPDGWDGHYRIEGK